MACQRESNKETYWFGHLICPECHKTLKKKIYDLNSSELRLQSTFYSFLAGVKYQQEQKDLLKQKRLQRKKLACA